MQLIDTHSHIYTKEFDNDRTEVIHRSREAGVSRIILPNIDVNSIAPLMDLANRYKGCCVPL
ncbi:MAG: hydrolase TatD, partial [Rikenellaceae bacterium]|nr:hydrolase TatD [Rikenellaceae bacterium]